MAFAATMLFCALLQQPAGLTPEQEKAALDRGQKYLDAVAASWAGKLPQERLLGVYLGRQWMGTHRISIKAAPAGGSAAVEIVHRSEGKGLKQEYTYQSRLLLDARLAPLSVEQVDTNDGKTSTLTLSTREGQWTIKEVKDGKTTERNGTLTPGILSEARFLPLFARPEEEGVRILSLTGSNGVNDFKRLSGTVEKTIDGKTQACQVLQINHPGEPGEQWYFAEDGRPLELRLLLKQGNFLFRLRPIPESAIGMPITDPLEVSPPVRRMLDLYLAIKSNDRKGILESFDFDRLAKETNPVLDSLPPAERWKVIADLREAVVKQMLSDKMRANLPDAAILEDVLAASLVEVQDGNTVKAVFRGGSFLLHQMQGGPRKSQWLIFRIE